ncbi:energy transducer TonB [Xanthomonas sp. AM6]|uniref:energy transducer TonB family protein n=1 Tax=Xanthomonas sp. AM6 TaxID=2982531 RepID=UPI0021D7DA92|nr:energy transducer TonB [Xanthomonas sp. AM6]UYB52941.1 energy transducer TonB [Xanthomonas sp. AM6]
MTSSHPGRGRPTRPWPRWLPAVLASIGLIAALGFLAWYLLFKDAASTRRPVADTPMVMLPPPPPPPPPEPEPEPEPEKEPEETMPEPEPLEEAPKPAEEAPTPDTADPVTMDADAQAGTDNFGIQSGSGGGMSGAGAGGGGGNASYGRYLGYVLQQAVSRDERIRRLAFQLTVHVWLDGSGALTRVELLRGSGNQEADEAVLAVIRAVGRVDEIPPASLKFPARVLVQGRRPAG